MDTDDLSKETYNAVLETADKFQDDLTLQFGLLSSHCDNDDDFPNQSEGVIKDWLEQEDLQYIIEDVFFDNPPKKTHFRQVLQTVLADICIVRQIPIDKRTFEFN